MKEAGDESLVLCHIAKSQFLSKNRKKPIGFYFVLLILKKTVTLSPIMKYFFFLIDNEKKKKVFFLLSLGLSL